MLSSYYSTKSIKQKQKNKTKKKLKFLFFSKCNIYGIKITSITQFKHQKHKDGTVIFVLVKLLHNSRTIIFLTRIQR